MWLYQGSSIIAATSEVSDEMDVMPKWTDLYHSSSLFLFISCILLHRLRLQSCLAKKTKSSI